MNIAGKTGTTTDNVDVWFAGFTPYYTAAVWAGYDNNHHLNSSAGETRYHLNIWREVMSRIHENLENKSFEMPDGITSATVCSASGKLPIPGICDGMMRNRILCRGYAADGILRRACDRRGLRGERRSGDGHVSGS